MSSNTLSTDRIGEVVAGKYQLVKHLGRGSYGTVWESRDTVLCRPVAIKMLHKGMGKVSDLLREARTQAPLSHDNIAKIYDVDDDERFIAMEFVDGSSLEDHLKKHIHDGTWLNIEESIDLLSQCFAGIAYAQKSNVVHGDIKPGNVMMTNDGRVKITDFGVAKVMSGDHGPQYSSRRLGSPTFAAPEVLTGQPRSYCSDVFSLGILAYLLFTGHHPFYNTHPSGLFNVRDMILSEEGVREPKDICQDLPDRYNAIVVKMLAKDANDRYANAQEAYEEFIDITLLCDNCRFRNPIRAKFCSECGNSLHETKEKSYREKNERELWQMAYEMNGIGNYEEAIRLSDLAIETRTDYWDAYHTRGFALSNLERYDEALASLRKALKYAKDNEGIESFKLANIHVSMGYCYERVGEYRKARNSLRYALKYVPNHEKARQLVVRGIEKGYWQK